MDPKKASFSSWGQAASPLRGWARGSLGTRVRARSLQQSQLDEKYNVTSQRNYDTACLNMVAHVGQGGTDRPTH